MRPRYETEGDADAINSKGVTWTGVRGGCEGEMLPKEEGGDEGMDSESSLCSKSLPLTS